MSHTQSPPQALQIADGERRKVALATMIGTTIEWYDFFIYALSAATVFATLFFKPMGEQGGQLASLLTIGLSFLFRPLGAFLAGYYGDKLGRRNVLVITLIMMGGATTLIGVLPTTAQAGMIAPVLLIFLRVIQGISAGGEWGGAILMAVEHAPREARGRAGAFPQIGVPIGMLLASGMLFAVGQWIPNKDIAWRIPFLVSFVLVIVGFVVRRTVEESPVFKEIAARSAQSKAPVSTLFRKHWLLVLLAALTFAGNNAAGYMTTGGFIQGYAGKNGIDKPLVMLAGALSAIVWLVFTWVGASGSDKIGRRKMYLIGWCVQLASIYPMLLLVKQHSFTSLVLGICIFAVGLGLCYGPQAAYFAELFPASIRFSGVSISYAIGAIIGGAFAPTIAQAIVNSTKDLVSVGYYLVGVTLLSLIANFILTDRGHVRLGPEFEAEQATGAIGFGLKK